MLLHAAGALTPEQEQAVARRGEALLVSAGAGSGKTSVLVERFVRAVCEDGVSPGRILAITFTDRAAGELRERVRSRLLERREREAARDTEAAFVSTFHGFCTRLLRAHALLAGVDPQFQILDEGLAARVRERAFALALGRFLAGERQPAVDLVAAYGADRLRTMPPTPSSAAAATTARGCHRSPAPRSVAGATQPAAMRATPGARARCSMSCSGALRMHTSSSSGRAARSTSMTSSCGRSSCCGRSSACARHGLSVLSS